MYSKDLFWMNVFPLVKYRIYVDVIAKMENLRVIVQKAVFFIEIDGPSW